MLFGINILAFITFKNLIANLFKTSHRVLFQIFIH